ncbi:MAG: hypothetical protein CVV14_04690 [Gammaproteobacteria bacterium HGW-Gammaproteobacteria-4]|jgi:hypothetical protein|nr:MAG: hypothetical protein CVV14_04690 [Gammaproteobacteria bacterium HGW-Gammaproteobacteria-4]
MTAITFDTILPALREVLAAHPQPRPLIVNRALDGRVRLILEAQHEADPSMREPLDALARALFKTLGPYAYPSERAFLFETDINGFRQEQRASAIEGCEGVWIVDRLATEGDWSSVAPVSDAVPRIVFYSIKGGVGRSTALAATAWALAERGKRVLVLDMDLESPGLSSSLLPEDRRPSFGITDWLVEDLVDNGDVVFDDMVAASDLSRNGDIRVVPAHGREPGEYVAKLGRVWMPKVGIDGRRESWSDRLSRMTQKLEERWEPDVTLIDSRAGIDEVASACITDLGASTVLMFCLEGEQTWSGYRILLRHWHNSGAMRTVRERLQVVGAMIPELGAVEYAERLQENAWNLFTDELYDAIPADASVADDSLWSFDTNDESAPHFPWTVRWHRGFAALQNLHGKLTDVDAQEVQALFGPLVEGVASMVELQGARR